MSIAWQPLKRSTEELAFKNMSSAASSSGGVAAAVPEATKGLQTNEMRGEETRERVCVKRHEKKRTKEERRSAGEESTVSRH